MSQYQDYLFFDEERESEYQMLQSPRFDEKNPVEVNFFTQKDLKKELTETFDVYPSTEISLVAQNTQAPVEYSPQKKLKRIKRIINITTERRIKRKEIFKGLKDDTTELNTNFKTLFSKKLKEITILRQVDSCENSLIQQFMNSVPSFMGIKMLCKSQKLKIKGLKFIKSSLIMDQILRSNWKMQNKMTMIKYMQSLKQNFESKQIIKWKQMSFQ